MSCDSEALEKAIALGVKTEQESIKFYREASERTSNRLGKAMFESFIKEEQKHLAVLKERFKSDGFRKAAGFRSRLRTVFEDALEDVGEKLKADPNDVAAIKIALDFERAGYEMYDKASGKVSDERAKEAFRFLAEAENEHYRVLRDIHEYLENTYSWFTREDCPILD